MQWAVVEKNGEVDLGRFWKRPLKCGGGHVGPPTKNLRVSVYTVLFRNVLKSTTDLDDSALYKE